MTTPLPTNRVHVDDMLAEYRLGDAEKRAELHYRMTLLIALESTAHGEAIAGAMKRIEDLEASKRRHGRRIEAVERAIIPAAVRDPADSGSFDLTTLELKQAKESLRKSEDQDTWLRRAFIASGFTLATSLLLAILFVAARVVAHGAAP
jgi:hypothetical protein